jgi:hypothetical protein
MRQDNLYLLEPGNSILGNSLSMLFFSFKYIHSINSKKCRTRLMEKQGGMAFGFQKMATAVIELDR